MLRQRQPCSRLSSSSRAIGSSVGAGGGRRCCRGGAADVVVVAAGRRSNTFTSSSRSITRRLLSTPPSAAAGKAARSSNGTQPPPPPRRVIGPEPPPRLNNNTPAGSSGGGTKPHWLRVLEEDAAYDEEVAQLLEGANGDPDVVRTRMQAKLASPPLYASEASSSDSPSSDAAAAAAAAAAGLPFAPRGAGSDAPPRVSFRDVDVFGAWVWLELALPPPRREQELLRSVVRAWFVVGKLGGFNSQNLQVYENNAGDLSYFAYDPSIADGAFKALMHEVTEVEFRGSWARFRVDLGTADELALDVLLNMLRGFSAEVAAVTRVVVGGRHERWATPDDEDEADEGAAEEGEEDDGDGGGGGGGGGGVGVSRAAMAMAFGGDDDGNGGGNGRDDDPYAGIDGGGRAGGDSRTSSGRRRATRRGEAPRVGIDPMQLPEGLEEELTLLDKLKEVWENDQQQQQGQGQEGGAGSASGLRPGVGGAPLGGEPGSLTASLRRRRQPQPQQQQQQQQAGGAAAAGVSLYTPEEFKRTFGGGGGGGNNGGNAGRRG